MTLAKAAEEYLLYQKVRKNRSDTTIDTYRSALRLFSEFTGDVRIDDLSIDLIDRYAAHLQQFNYAPKTYYNKLVPIRCLVKHLYAKDRINIRPESIDLPSVEDTEANFLTPEELGLMIAACQDERERAVVLVLARSGVRVSELINIKTEDVYDQSVLVRRGKGKKNRITFLSDDALEAVRDYHATLGFDPTYLICGRDNTQLSRQYIWKVIKRIAKRAGIKKEIKPHTMRHTCGTWLLMNGMSIQDVQQILGHANIQTTLIYAHFTNDYLKEQYNKTFKLLT